MDENRKRTLELIEKWIKEEEEREEGHRRKGNDDGTDSTVGNEEE